MENKVTFKIAISIVQPTKGPMHLEFSEEIDNQGKLVERFTPTPAELINVDFDEIIDIFSKQLKESSKWEQFKKISGLDN